MGKQIGGQKGISMRDCAACPFRATSLVCRAAEGDLPPFLKLVHRFLYDPRQVVFYEGHESLGLYVLCSGKVKLTSSSFRGHQRIVGIVGAGDLIEQSGFCEGAGHGVTCETLEASQVCLIERKGYLELLEKNPSLATELLQLVSRETLPINRAVGGFSSGTTIERVAAVLVDLGKRFGSREPDGLKLDIRLTREELAELAGVAPETVIRLLSRFKRERIVTTNGREIKLLKPERLAKIADLLQV